MSNDSQQVTDAQTSEQRVKAAVPTAYAAFNNTASKERWTIRNPMGSTNGAPRWLPLSVPQDTEQEAWDSAAQHADVVAFEAQRRPKAVAPELLCKGSIALGSGCGMCRRCKEEIARLDSEPVAQREGGECQGCGEPIYYAGQVYGYSHVDTTLNVGCDARPFVKTVPAVVTRLLDGASEGRKVGIYVASRASIPERSQMWRDYQWHGFPIISSWINEAGEGETDSMAELWQRIGMEIASCRALVFYAQTEDLPLKGALIEVGMALALNKPVFAVLPGVELEPKSMRPIGSWLNHPLVAICASVDIALNAALSSRAPEDAKVTYRVQPQRSVVHDGEFSEALTTMHDTEGDAFDQVASWKRTHNAICRVTKITEVEEVVKES